MKIFKNQEPQVLYYGEISKTYAGSGTMQQCPRTGHWIPARAHPFRTGLWARLRCAWLVFTGRADALMPFHSASESKAGRVHPANRKPVSGGRHG